MTAPFHHGKGSAPSGPLTTALDTAYEVDVTPESAGWGFTSLRVVVLPLVSTGSAPARTR